MLTTCNTTTYNHTKRNPTWKLSSLTETNCTNSDAGFWVGILLETKPARQIMNIIEKSRSATGLIIIGLLWTCLPVISIAQDSYYEDDYLRYSDHIYKEYIHSVQLSRKGHPLSEPVVQLNSADALRLEFDDFSEDVNNYSYTWILCNADWTETAVMEQDYLPGLPEDFLVEYEFAQNTTQPYVHYTLDLPSATMPFGISGNHLLLVFQEGDRDNLILTRRFYVIDNKVTINGRAHAAAGGGEKGRRQEVDFTVQHPSYPINDPIGEVKVTIQQNGRIDNQVTNLKPLFINGPELSYDMEIGNVFESGNEFREIDMKNFRVLTSEVDSVTFDGQRQHVWLKTDFSRKGRAYGTDFDINGRHYVKLDDFNEGLINPDYAMVHFFLKSSRKSGDVHIVGDFGSWGFTSDNRMIFDAEKGGYKLDALIKQGMVNYQYLYVETGAQIGSVTEFENSHYETENEYHVFVYHRAAMDRHDKLIGYKVINTRR